MPDQTLAQRVRAKYPGVYDDLSDTDLEAKVKAKYPGVYDDIPTTQGVASTQTPPSASHQGAISTAIDTVIGIPGATETAKGIVKSGLGMIEGGGKLIRSIPVVGPALASVGSVTLPVSTKPSNMNQQVGKTAGDIAAFFAPASALTKAKTALQTARPLVNALTEMGLEGASATGISGLQTGDPKAALTTGLATAATTGAVQALKPAARMLGEKIEKVLIRPQKADLADGFQVGNVFKYGLGGTLKNTIEQSDTKLNGLNQSLSQVLTASPTRIDVLDALQEADTRMRKAAEAGHSSLSYPEMKRSSDLLLEKLLPLVTGNGGDPVVDLAKANQAKRIVGDIGAWTHGLGGQVSMGTDANALEQYANTLYDVLKNRIEGAATGPVKSLNKAMSDIIAVRRAAIRRLPVAERQNVIGLTDALAAVKGGPGGIALSIMNHVLKSGHAAKALVAGSEASSAAPVTGRVVGALTSESQ